MEHTYYSTRTGNHPHLEGVSLEQFKNIFERAYTTFRNDGYFDENLGSWCIDEGE